MAVTVVAGALLASLPVTIDGASFGHKTALAVGNGNGNGGVGQGAGQGATNGSLGGDSSSLGSLNSARADTQAFAHANREHSPVGALASYMESMVDYADSMATYDAKMTEYDALIEAADLLPPGPAKDALLEEAAGVLAEAEAALADANASLADAGGYLLDAANKDGLIDAAVVDAVNSLLDGKSDGFMDDAGYIEGSSGDLVLGLP